MNLEFTRKHFENSLVFITVSPNVESIRRGNFAKYLFLGVWSPRKSYLSLQNFENTLPENLICSYGISFCWKILCVLTNFWTRFLGKFDLFLLYFFLLENRMCSCEILRKLSWKFWCVLLHFASPEKLICVLITSKPPGKFDVF